MNPRTDTRAALLRASETLVAAPGAQSSLIPATSGRGEIVRRAFAAATLLYAAYYLGWRWTRTLNPEALWFAVPLALAETFALISTAFFVFNVWRLRRRSTPPARPGLSVDVFITTYNEPLELIRKTALGARSIRYAHRTYILDDGARADVRELAAELGVEYIRRPTNEGAKAGNLNHALRHTSGDYILQLDADHVPMPQMLDHLLGYFEDERLAFVQAPQCFYNQDSFTGHADARSGRYFAEQDIFFNVIQPGKDRHNAAFFCGSCAVIRRDAVLSIGGFSAHSITEDFETSLRLHARGWRSAYHCEPLAFGLSARTAESFHTQRLRWGRGTLQVLRRFNPLTLRGLSLPQRLCYFYSVLVYLDGLPRLVFYAAPVIYLFAGVLPIGTTGVSFLAHFVPLFAAAVTLNRVMARGHAAPFWLLERNNLAKVWTHTLALTGYFTRQPLHFGVTGKGVGGVAIGHLLPHALLLLATLGALVWGTIAFVTSGGRYGSAGAASVPFLINVAWATWNGILAALVLHTAVRSRERRSEYRFLETLPVGVGCVRDGKLSFEIGTLLDVSSTGAALRVCGPLPPGTQVRLLLMLPDGQLAGSAVVIHARTQRLGDRSTTVAGVAFAGHDRTQLDRLALHCLQHVAPYAQQETYKLASMPRFRRNRRQERRTRVSAAALLSAADHHTVPMLASARNVSEQGACFESFTPIPKGTMIRYEIPHLERVECGEVVQLRRVATCNGNRHVINVARREPAARPRIIAVLNQPAAAPGDEGRELIAAARIAVTAGMLLVMLAAFAARASGQMSTGYVGAVEAADNGQRVYVLGGWLVREQPGLSPTASLFGYRIELADHPSLDGIWAINPAAGLRYQASAGAVQGTVGYMWQSGSSRDDLSGEAARVSSGVTTALQGDYWGNGGLMAQGIASYSWGGDGYIWSRARVTGRIAAISAGALRLGAELGWQGNDEYNALDTGGVLELHRLPLVLSLAIGYRSVGEGAADSAPYVSLAAVVIPK